MWLDHNFRCLDHVRVVPSHPHAVPPTDSVFVVFQVWWDQPITWWRFSRTRLWRLCREPLTGPSPWVSLTLMVYRHQLLVLSLRDSVLDQTRVQDRLPIAVMSSSAVWTAWKKRLSSDISCDLCVLQLLWEPSLEWAHVWALRSVTLRTTRSIILSGDAPQGSSLEPKVSIMKGLILLFIPTVFFRSGVGDFFCLYQESNPWCY